MMVTHKIVISRGYNKFKIFGFENKKSLMV